MRLAIAILTAIAILLTSAWVVIFTRPIQHALLAATPVETESLARRAATTNALLDYFSGSSPSSTGRPLPSPQRGGGIKGEGVVDRFTARELAHLTDVRGLILGLRAATLLTLAALLWLFAVALRRGHVAKLTTALGVGAKVNFMAVAALALLGLLAFPFLFDAFHRVAFRNDLWQLPLDATLLRLYPQAYFALGALTIVLLDLLLATVVWLGLRVRPAPQPTS